MEEPIGEPREEPIEDTMEDTMEDISMEDISMEDAVGDADMSMMDQLEEYLSEGEYDYQLPKRGDIHTGIVIEIGDRGAIVDAGFKRDGIVPASDLDRLDDETLEAIEPGDEVYVAVTKPQDEEGRLILSIYQALVREDWEKAEEMMEGGELYEGTISGFNRVVCSCRSVGFVASSQHPTPWACLGA